MLELQRHPETICEREAPLSEIGAAPRHLIPRTPHGWCRGMPETEGPTP